MRVPEKALPSIFSSEAGRQIEISEESSRNAYRPISVKQDPGSNAMVDRDRHLEKHSSRRIVTEAGSEIH
jgi:hypothetical protein